MWVEMYTRDKEGEGLGCQAQNQLMDLVLIWRPVSVLDFHD